ncbi:hypothetical protein Ddye_017972 [Dipteronia dyeriana]|uniref:D-isomer specific 2-hydroxyacid dehydrogenase NAD-binding domain-containing protein n=1 Tax=Dipteronia dyeriana TaxID=168575 RepID=A0AAD9UAC4_9ROSI|nr:hypothetical protein Ddye_017972 [Dipteronia dyeriana]
MELEIHKKYEHQQPKDLPRVLVVKPPPPMAIFGDKYLVSEKFKLLKAWESPLPLEEFLISNSQSIQAMLCTGFAMVTLEILRPLPSLRLVVSASSGVHHINLPECRRRGIAVTNSGNAYSDDCADATVGLLIEVWRKVSAADRYVRQGLWMSRGDYAHGSKLGGKRIGIVGLGKIGLEVAKRLKPFGCTILYNSKKEKPAVSYTLYPKICQLSANSNALIIFCGLTDQTRQMIDRQV